jgi:hypothetical protein
MHTQDVTKSTTATTDNHHSSVSKQHDADHAKNAFAVSGTSPTPDTRQSASAPPTPDTTPPKLCTRIGCQNPITGKRRLYCSKVCSAATRNRRYYLTLQGRLNKRAGMSRYFQNHREKLYENKRARMDQYVVELIKNGEVDFIDGRISSNRISLEDEQYTALAAHNLARVRHDWHGGPHDGPVGKPKYFFTRDGRAVLMDHNSRGTAEQTLAWRAMRDEIMSKWQNEEAAVPSSQSAQKTEVSNDNA